MRIDISALFTGRIVGEKATGKANSASKSNIDQSDDEATLSADGIAVQSLQAQVLQMPEVRRDMVDGLREQVRHGDYRVESGKVADAIIAAHQLM